MNKPADNKPIDGEYGLNYQIFVLRRMVDELPENINGLLLTQIDVVIKAIDIRQKILMSQIMPKLLDLHLDIKYMEFDRQIVQNERDDLAARLKGILGND